jgi:DNA-binding transcriptional LysR family regulator
MLGIHFSKTEMEPRNMELNHLKYFYVVAREKSFTRAAKVLRVQQPTLSKMVRGLEAQLGVILLERHKLGVQLTTPGQEVFQNCEDIFARVDLIQNVTDNQRSECEGFLGFGATDSVSSYILPRITAAFLKDNPKVRPSIFAGSSNLICNEIIDNRIEFGLFFSAPEVGGLQTSEILQVPFGLVIATHQVRSALTKKSFILSRDIDYPKSRPFPVLEMLKKNKIKVETLISSNNLDAQKELVKEGLGTALLPRFMVKSGLQKGTLTRLAPRCEFGYSLKLVYRKGKILSRNASVFLETFRSLAADLL